MTILDHLKDHITPPQPELSKTERVALKNIINLAKERIWLAESHPQIPPIHSEFEPVLTEQDITNSKQSLVVIGQLQSKLNDADA